MRPTAVTSMFSKTEFSTVCSVRFTLSVYYFMSRIHSQVGNTNILYSIFALPFVPVRLLDKKTRTGRHNTVGMSCRVSHLSVVELKDRRADVDALSHLAAIAVHKGCNSAVL